MSASSPWRWRMQQTSSLQTSSIIPSSSFTSSSTSSYPLILTHKRRSSFTCFILLHNRHPSRPRCYHTGSHNAGRNVCNKFQIRESTVTDDDDDDVSASEYEQSLGKRRNLNYELVLTRRALWRKVISASTKVRGIVLLNVVTLLYGMSLLNSLKIKRYEDKSVQYISQPLGGNEPILQQSRDHFYEVRASAPGGVSASSSARPVNVIQPEPVTEKDVQQPPLDSGLEPDATAVHLKPAETVAASPGKGKLQVSTVIEEEVAVGKKKGRGGKRSALGPTGPKKKIKVGEIVNLSDLGTPEVEIHSPEGRQGTPFLTSLEAHASGDDEVEEGDEGVKGAGGDEGNSSTVVKRVAAAFAQSVMVDPAQSDDIFVPGWTLRNKDRVNDSTLAKNMLFNLATPADHIHHREMTNVDVSQAFLVNQAQSNFIGIEMYRRWVDSEARLAKLLKRGPPCNKHDALIEDLKSEVIQSKATIQAGQAALAAATEARDSALSEVDNLKGLMKKRESEVNHNISEMEKVLAQMRTNYATLEDEKKKLIEEKKELESNFSKVSAESQGLRSTIDDHLSFKKFILTEGMELVSRHLHKGPVMTKAVSDVVNAMNLCGFAEGIKAGYDGAASGIPLDKNVQVPANVDTDLNAAVQAFDTIVFPEIQKLQDLVGEDIGMVVTTLRGLKIQDAT